MFCFCAPKPGHNNVSSLARLQSRRKRIELRRRSPGRGGQIGIDRAAEGASSAGALRLLLFGRIIAERGSAQDSEAVASNCQLKPRSSTGLSVRASCLGTASHLNCVEDLDGVDIRLLAPAIGTASANARLAAHSAWLQAAMPLGQKLLGGCEAKWITRLILIAVGSKPMLPCFDR